MLRISLNFSNLGLDAMALTRAFVLGGAVSACALGMALIAFWLIYAERATARAEAARESFLARYSEPLPPLEPPFAAYHLGHSLVGRDMPAMLAQLGGHEWQGQLGWGASLRQHWQGAVPGFDAENAHPAYRDAHEAVGSGDYQVLVLTEMVALEDALRSHDSVAALTDWAGKAFAARPDLRLYLYETWHARQDPQHWRDRLDHDLPALWEGKLVIPALAELKGRAIHVIPGGQVMVAFARAASEGRLPEVSSEAVLFSDDIHFNDHGAYLMALTHYAVIYGRSPVGLPRELRRADGSAADAPPAALAQAMQEIVWEVVTSYRPSGVPQAEG